MKKMMFIAVAPILSLGWGSGLAQDPFKVAPDAYRLQFENDWVKIARVHYGPREKLPAHDHPKAGTLFVYLNDGGPVRFQHVQAGAKPFPLVRPATRAGGFRLAQAVSEHHEVENLSDLPSDFLRVELKTDPVDANAFRGRFPPESMEASLQKLAFENGQVLISRVACTARESFELERNPGLPALLVALSPIHAVVTSIGGGIVPSEMALGQTLWLEPRQKATLKNRGDATVQQILIQFRTKPMKSEEGVER